VLDLFARPIAWIRRLFRREPAPGRWVEGSAFAFAGFIGIHPFIVPRRAYRLYVPRGYGRRPRAPLLVMLHGCRQTGAELAQGTRIAAWADQNRVLVLMPEQTDGANPYRCWNWFDTRTAAGRGEAAIVAKMIEKVRNRWRADPDRVTVAGMSAGAALAAVLGVRHPELVRAVATHSGIACGAALSAYTAISVMKRGPETDVAEVAKRARGTHDVRVPLLAVQGAVDDVVAPRHAEALARQYLALNGVEVPEGGTTALPPPFIDTRDATRLPHVTRTREWHRDGAPVVRLVDVQSLGHAWSGGDASLPFNEPDAPDATALIGAWLAGLPR
jgi:poly(hydroxyalkanoate) depolymerase family esterase